MTTYIGVDVGKRSLQIYSPINNESFEVTNNNSGFNKFINYLNKHYGSLSNAIIVFEPTGGYEQALRTFLKMHCLNFSCVHQNKVRHYAKAKGWLAKTDKIDSKLISDYARAFTLKVTQTYDSDNQQILHNLIKRREQLLLCKGQELARLDKFSDIAILESLKKHVEYLDQNLKSIETRIKEICNSDTQIKNNITNLTSIPGVGIVLATNVIANLPELGNINIRKATSLIGLAPYARESSSYRGRRTIFAGRGNIRKIFYMAAVASLRCNKKLKTYYDRLIINHKPPKVALVAVMRKLLTFIHAILKNNTVWNQDYRNP